MKEQALLLTDIQKYPNEDTAGISKIHTDAKSVLQGAFKYGEVDGATVVKNWFGSINADVFISHSGKDHNKVLGLASKLKSEGFKPFVDSLFWGNVDELIKTTFQNQSKNDLTTAMKFCADYYMLLSMALVEMIESTRAFIFVDSSNSLNSNISGNTTSPWIYLELKTAEKRYPITLNESYLSHATESVSFPTPTTWLKKIKRVNYLNLMNTLRNG